MKEDQTREVSLNVSEDAGWARCPICNEVWRTCQFRHPWYGTWDVEHYGLPPGNISEQSSTIDGKKEIKYCSYRKDLGRVKKKSFQDILEITHSPAFIVKRM